MRFGVLGGGEPEAVQLKKGRTDDLSGCSATDEMCLYGSRAGYQDVRSQHRGRTDSAYRRQAIHARGRG